MDLSFVVLYLIPSGIFLKLRSPNFRKFFLRNFFSFVVNINAVEREIFWRWTCKNDKAQNWIEEILHEIIPFDGNIWKFQKVKAAAKKCIWKKAFLKPIFSPDSKSYYPVLSLSLFPAVAQMGRCIGSKAIENYYPSRCKIVLTLTRTLLLEIDGIPFSLNSKLWTLNLAPRFPSAKTHTWKAVSLVDSAGW